MSASTRLTTALHALSWMEFARRHGREPLTSTDIAASLLSNPVLIRRTLAPLRDHDLLIVSGRGPGTGWRMAKSAADVTLADIHEALNDGPRFNLHPHEPNQQCPIGYGIRPVLDALYTEIDDAVAATLACHTIADLVDTVIRDHPLPDARSTARKRIRQR